MDTHQYYDRKQYVEQVRSSFSGNNEKKRYSYTPEKDVQEPEVRGFFKVRFILAVVLFFAFLFIQQTNFSYQDINAAKIADQIRKTVSLPDSVPALSELIHIVE